MSPEGRLVPCRTLGEYVGELVARLADAEPHAYERLRAVVAGRQARIGLDQEDIVVRFGSAGLEVAQVRGGDAPLTDGEGTTDRRTVLNLLDGYLEVSQAVRDGRLLIRGDSDAVVAMFHAIEVLLDVSARAPALQALADDFRADPCREPVPPRPPMPPGATRDEAALLRRLGLLPKT